MAERKIYQGGLVRSVGIPSVSFAQYQEMASGANTMQRKLDSLVNFAIKKEEKVQIEEAKTYAASNPITVNDYINASPVEREKLVGGNKDTSYGQTVRATQLSFLSTEMAIKAQKDFMSLKIEANTTNMPLDEYENQLNAIVQGYSDAVLDVDAEAAITVKADLASKASAYYSSYSDKIVKDYKNLTDSTTLIFGDELVDTIPDEMSKGHIVTIIGEDGTAQQVGIDEHLNLLKNRYRLQLLGKGMKKEDFVKWEGKWDAKILQTKKNILFGEFVDKPENLISATSATKIWKQVQNGNFNDNKKLQAIYNSLDENEQAEFRNSVREWKNNRIKSIEDNEKAFDLDIKTKKDDLEIKYLEAVRNKDFGTANAIVEEAKGVDTDLYKDLLTDIQQDKEDGDFLDLQKLTDQNIITSHRWQPALSGIVSSGKMNNTGSEIRIAYDLAMSTVIRDTTNILLEPIKRVINAEMGIDTSDLTVAYEPPISFLADIDPKQVLTINEQRAMLNKDLPNIPDGELLISDRQTITVQRQQENG